ncbi:MULTISPECIES: hypothetical protein [unclassified Rhodosalinus]|uniref:hypothetical protein n=1 Tax=unclassified Rhodosalinus TaxID=2630183 RepID=UPI0035249E39
MDRLSIVVTLLTGPVLVGGLVITVLSLGFYSWIPIAAAVVAGLLLTWPAAYAISRRIKRKDPHWNVRSGKPGSGKPTDTDFPET